MKATLLEMKKEAIKRLGMLEIPPKVLSDFKDGVINVSQQMHLGNIPIGVLSLVNEGEKEFIEQFEKRYNVLVYHTIYTPCSFGNCLSLLFVSNDKREWKSDCVDLRRGFPYVYVLNITDDDCSEFGRIVIRSTGSGLIRTA